MRYSLMVLKGGGIKVKHDAPYSKTYGDTKKGDSTSVLRYPEFEMGRRWDFSVFYPELAQLSRP